MTLIALLRAADRKPIPWKNGAGVTQEVAVCPPGAGYDDFLWRVSIATISGESAFSMLPGVRRLFSALEGRLSISIDGQSRDVGPHDPPMAFDGSSTISARPLDGPARDLNLMMREGCSGSLSQMSGIFQVSTDIAFLLATGPTTVKIGERRILLDSLDVLSIESGRSCTVESSAPVIGIEITHSERWDGIS